VASPNLLAGWAGIVLGFLAGAAAGLFFHKDEWLGGYSSWPRRMLRLGHISFFGIGFINLAFAFTVAQVRSTQSLSWASWLLIVGAVTMPLCCYASAFWKPFRHLFFIPVLSLVVAAALLVLRGGLLR